MMRCRSAWISGAWVLPILIVGLACEQPPPKPDYVARVGDSYLTRAEVYATLSALPRVQDTTEAQQQIVEQWVTNELIFQEARRLRLRDDPDVRRMLEKSERSVLISAYVSRLFTDEAATPTPADIQAYYEQHGEQLRLREPYVRLRYLATVDPDSARLAHTLLRQSLPGADSTWEALVFRFAEDPDGSMGLTHTYSAESQLFTAMPEVRSALARLKKGELAPLFQAGGRYHVLQLVDRAPPGTLPRLPWVEEELERRLEIETRKQLYARQVQRLRTEALAHETLEIR